MTDRQAPAFTPRGDTDAIETGSQFQPKFDAGGLIPAIVTDSTSGAVLMFAHMNAEALSMTLQTGIAHFWSRSRQRLWKKGEESGNSLTVAEIRTDCDQDVLWLSGKLGGDGVACHTGAVSCFYRRLDWTAGPTAAVTLKYVAPPKDRRST